MSGGGHRDGGLQEGKALAPWQQAHLGHHVKPRESNRELLFFIPPPTPFNSHSILVRQMNYVLLLDFSALTKAALQTLAIPWQARACRELAMSGGQAGQTGVQTLTWAQWLPNPQCS